jgi:hypothetical protein
MDVKIIEKFEEELISIKTMSAKPAITICNLKKVIPVGVGIDP